jgi:type IV pilus biogenesis protein CpaD/CtpE
MKKATVIAALVAAMAALAAGCAGNPKVRTSELDNRGNAL